MKNKCDLAIFDFISANRSQSEWNELLREFEILRHVNTAGHDNVIKLFGACTQTGI